MLSIGVLVGLVAVGIHCLPSVGNDKDVNK